MTSNNKINLSIIASVLLFSSASVFSADKGVLLAAQNMISSGKSLDALELLSPHEEEYAGDKEYDYLYGLALLDTGDSSDAIFAFQRALAVEPNFAGARLELARSYFNMGQMQRARREFQVLNSQAPPQSVRDVIEKYLAAIESRNLSNRQGWRGFLQLGIGDDSNVNNGPAAESFLGFTLSDETREAESSVISTIGGARYDLPVNFDSKFFFSGSVNHRANNDASFASTVNYDLLAGYSRSFANRNEFSAAIQPYSAEVDGEFNNKGLNLTFQYNLNFSSTNQMGLFLRTGSVEYTSEFSVRDIDQNIFGLSWAHVFSGDSRISMVVAAIVGTDEAVEMDSPYGRDFNGLRVSMAYPFSHRLNLFASLGGTTSDYEGTFFTPPQLREDTQSDFSLGTSWRANKTWQLKALLSVSRNTSSIELFEYDRSQIMFTARSEFTP